MCGRAYSTYTEEEIQLRYLNKRTVKLPKFKANFNFSPTQDGLVMVTIDGEKTFELMHWGLIPPWSEEFKTKFSTINAKSETIFESRLYRGPIVRKRCVAPLSGFIEWKRDGEKKRPFCIHLKDQPILSAAGIWESWKKDGEERHSFSLLTTAANSFMEKIHDRMPVILDERGEEAWLDPENQKPEQLNKLMKACPSSWLAAYEVSTLVNSPRNNSKEVLLPLKSG